MRASLISTASLYDDDAGITCYGYIPPGLPGVHKFHETLAEFCIDEVGADCTQIMASDADLQDPNAPETTIVGFDSLEGHIDVYREMEPLNIDEILGDDVVQNIQRRELICESKCICTKDILTDTTNGNGGGVPSLNRSFWQSPGIPKHASLDNSAHEPENVWEWNFDDHKARSRPRSGRQEKVFWRGGHGFAGWGWSFYVGAEENRPTCSAGRLSDIPDGSSSPLNQEHYGSIAEACLHRYYGGSNFTNKGGICQRTEEGERILVFPYSLSAPWFLGEFDYDPTYQVLPYPAGVAAKYSLKDFAEGQTLSHPHAASLFHWEYTCWANCWCDDKEKETKENIEQWLLLKGHYYHGITENDLQKFGLLGSSGRGKPEAPNRRLSKSETIPSPLLDPRWIPAQPFVDLLRIIPAAGAASAKLLRQLTPFESLAKGPSSGAALQPSLLAPLYQV
ncbi:MAG: hypothetical protein M1814_004349 [Vezdaea aestivalis]|nr:MAG: hypothetical protein M1814_004349 [Vezdaea aestivalis]